jgi:hypothetical protein
MRAQAGGTVEEEEEIVSSTPLGPAATWTKEFLAKQAEEKRRAMAAEVDAVTTRIGDVLHEMAALINPDANREHGPMHLPGQGPRGAKIVLQQHGVKVAPPAPGSTSPSSPQVEGRCRAHAVLACSRCRGVEALRLALSGGGLLGCLFAVVDAHSHRHVAM